jgi:hypothetical protein
MSDTNRENRLRRAARKQGLMVEKSRKRNPNAYQYGTYMLIDGATNTVVATSDHETGFGLSLDDIEAELQGKSH